VAVVRAGGTEASTTFRSVLRRATGGVVASTREPSLEVTFPLGRDPGRGDKEPLVATLRSAPGDVTVGLVTVPFRCRVYSLNYDVHMPERTSTSAKVKNYTGTTDLGVGVRTCRQRHDQVNFSGSSCSSHSI
jgi:hypothetical protein